MPDPQVERVGSDSIDPVGEPGEHDGATAGGPDFVHPHHCPFDSGPTGRLRSTAALC